MSNQMIFSSWPAWTQNGLIIFALICLLALCIVAIIEITRWLRNVFDKIYGVSNRDIDSIAKILTKDYWSDETKLSNIDLIVRLNMLQRLRVTIKQEEEE